MNNALLHDRNNSAELACDVESAPICTKSIAEMAAKFGVSLRTLRFYEERGLLSPARIKTNRYYTPKDEIRLEIIQKCKTFGFSLTATEQFILPIVQPGSHQIGNVQLSLSQKQIDEQIAVLEKDRMRVTTALEELYDAQKRLS